jgi:serine/threonine-protein kinase
MAVGAAKRKTMSGERFVAQLEASQILPAEQIFQLERLFKSGQTDAKALSDWLIEKEWLTPWQAGHLLDGETHFFLGDYLLLDHIATGGMGAVYRARKWESNDVVAVKLLSQQSTADPVHLARFRREIALLSTLQHPTIVKAYHAESIDTLVYLVMEYVKGMDLWEWLRQHVQLPIDFSCEVIRQACCGLEYAWEFGLIHRDLKPANLIVTWPADGGPPLCKILDLGLARLRDGAKNAKPITTSGQFVGTPDYVSPEQCRDARQVDTRSDIYSLGVTLFEMLTGTVPFRAATPLEAIMMKEVGKAPMLRSRLPSAPEELEAVVAKMLANKPEDRYRSPGEAAAALEPFCELMRHPDI